VSRDESEIEALLAAFLAAVTFEAGTKPDYAAIRELFIPRGLLIRNSGEVPDVASVEEFIAPRQASVDSGALTEFEETELAGVTERFGNVAHRFSGYGKRGVLDGTPFTARGAIATQFVRTPAGWRISAMAWDDERPGLTVPAAYL
jgi:hypothetical protein